MRLAVALFALVLVSACGEGKKPLDEPGQRLYPLSGTIVARDTADNTVRVSHERIAGFMEAMTMDFSVRGASVNELPADGTRIKAQLHVTDRAYWLTGVARTE
jgi:hypothetical protein